MPYRSPISRRVITSFVLLTTLVSGMFAYGVYFAVESMERDLVQNEIQREFSVVLSDYYRKQIHTLDKDTFFFAGAQESRPELSKLPPGFSETLIQGEAYTVYHAIDGGMPFYLMKKQLAQARHKSLVRAIVVTGFLTSVLAALLLALVTVKNIIAPVRLLTTQVRGRKKITHELSPLALEYPNDEVGQLAEAFDHTFLMLDEALQREELFTSDVSHELRTPLMMIRSSCELLIEKDQLDAFTLARIRIIAKATEEIQELVNAFLSLARDTPPDSEQATLLEVVESAKDSWQQYANERNLNFCIENQSNGDSETFTRPLLRAVLNNLVRNAIHHSRAGDMKLVLKKNGFEVRDSGSGISEKDRPLIYKPFYRGQTRETGGIGLGLSLSYRICKHEGWQLTYQYNQPTGSCFIVNFS